MNDIRMWCHAAGNGMLVGMIITITYSVELTTAYPYFCAMINGIVALTIIFNTGAMLDSMSGNRRK